MSLVSRGARGRELVALALPPAPSRRPVLTPKDRVARQRRPASPAHGRGDLPARQRPAPKAPTATPATAPAEAAPSEARPAGAPLGISEEAALAAETAEELSPAERRAERAEAETEGAASPAA